MVKIICASATMLILSACSIIPNKIQTQLVNIPVLFCPSPPTIVRPVLPIESITTTDDDGDIVLKYKATVRGLINYSEQLEQALNFYNNLPHSPTLSNDTNE